MEEYVDLTFDDPDEEWQFDDSIPWTVDVGVFAYVWLLYYIAAFILAIAFAILLFCFYKNISDFFNTVSCGLFSSLRSLVKCCFGVAF